MFQVRKNSEVLVVRAYYIRHATDGYLTLGSDGRWENTPLLADAKSFVYKKAMNVLNNSIPPDQRDKYSLEVNSGIPYIKDTVFDFDWEQLLNSQIELYDRLHIYKEELTKSLHSVELEINDIQHFIELTDGLNAAEGYKAYRLLRQRLQYRRQIKDEMMKMDYMMNDSLFEINAGKLADQINRMAKRRYCLRVHHELFRENEENSRFPDKSLYECEIRKQADES